jgi:esterase
LPLHHQLLGDSGPWVLLLHGLFGSGDNLATLGRALAAEHRVALVDLRNHGRSPHGDSMALSALAADVAALQEQLGTGPCALMGHSLGGKVVMQLALTAAERVTRLVVGDIAPVRYPPHHQTVFEALAAVDLEVVRSRGDADRAMSQHLPDPNLRLFLLKSLQKEGEGYHWRFNLAALRNQYEAICDAPAGQPWPGPALFIKGGDSDYITAAAEPAIAALFPNFQFRAIAGAGHWLHGDRPVAFNRLVSRFLA